MDNSLIKRFINGVCRALLANGNWEPEPERDEYTDIGFRAGYTARCVNTKHTDAFTRDFIRFWYDYIQWRDK